MIGTGGGPVEMTSEGGLAVWMINKTGAASFKGAVVEADSGVDNAVNLLDIDEPDPIGIVYDDGIADGDWVRVVFSGRAEVFYVGSTTRHYFGRNCVAADVGAAAGKAIAEPVPVPPFSTDKHFMEIGHLLESRVGAGLALTMLHFN
jgi:hypothetical protein